LECANWSRLSTLCHFPIKIGNWVLRCFFFMKSIFDPPPDSTSLDECKYAIYFEKCEELTEKYIKYFFILNDELKNSFDENCMHMIQWIFQIDLYTARNIRQSWFSMCYSNDIYLM
jgi:hypothetical protein